jgi:hypothetical protein
LSLNKGIQVPNPTREQFYANGDFNPSKENSHNGCARRFAFMPATLADGYYAVVPQDMLGRNWLPNLESAAAGIATAIYGFDNVVVMGLGAARLYGVIPRALSTAIVAIPRQHRPIALSDRPAIVRFVKRDTSALDAERIGTELGPALVTTPEQTVVDLAHRPTLGDNEADIPTAVTALYTRSDKQRLKRLAVEQRRLASLSRAEEWAGISAGS